MGIEKIIKKEKFMIGIWKITENIEELEQIAKDAKIKQKYQNKKRNREFITSRLLLQKINPEYFIRYNKLGAPILNNKKYISISHSNKITAIMISSLPVGIDIEEQSKRALKVSAKFINKENIKKLNDDKATIIWSAKEAIYKWNMEKSVDFIKDIKIEDFKVKNRGVLQAYFRKKIVKLNYQKIYNHYLVYICQNKPKNEYL